MSVFFLKIFGSGDACAALQVSNPSMQERFFSVVQQQQQQQQQQRAGELLFLGLAGTKMSCQLRTGCALACLL